MEKIYIDQEQNNRRQKRNKKFNSLRLSFGLSFVVAFVAIASILFVSLSGVSYAVDDVETLPVNITTLASESEDVMDDGANGVTIYRATAEGSSESFLVYCMESAEDYYDGVTLTRTKEISDNGLIYLLAKLDAAAAKSDEYAFFVFIVGSL